MLRFWKHLINSQEGQILPVVLALLVLGGLTIVPALNYTTTNLNSGQAIKRGVTGLYAAEAGVENVLWCLKNAVSPPQQLPTSINQMQVALQTENKGAYTLYSDEFVQTKSHNNYLGVSGEMIWDAGANAYKYTITIIWQPGSGTPTIHLVEVGVRLPLGYGYRSGSAAGFAGNLSTSEPNKIMDSVGAQMLNWEFASPYPSVSQSAPVRTQIFYITGTGAQSGDYAWVVANRSDIGTVSEISGTLYRITATATHQVSGKITAKIVADTLINGQTVYIISWQILK